MFSKYTSEMCILYYYKIFTEYPLCSGLAFKHEKIKTVCETGMIPALTEFLYLLAKQAS